MTVNTMDNPIGKYRPVLVRYGIAVLATLIATLARKALDPVLENSAPFSAYYAAVMFTAWYAGLGPSLFALVAGTILADWLFIEPHLSLLAFNLEHQVGLGLYLVVGVMVATLSESLHASRRRTEMARAELAAANRELQKEIAERRQAECWLLESEQRFRGYFEQGLVAMAMLSADKAIVEVNPRLCQMLGYPEFGLLDKKWTDLVHPADLPQEEGHFQRLLDGLAKGYVSEMRLVRRDGKVLSTSVSVQQLRKTDGAIDCVLVLIQDLTEKHRVEESARLPQEQLLEQRRDQSALRL
jgi:PAS domain S-box-containing protein